MNELLEFVNRDLLRDTSQKVDAYTPLFDDGLIDSLKILQLIAFVELKTGRNIPDREIVMSNFRTVQVITDRFLHEHERVH
jgi:acyl carrier protein